MQVNHLKCLSAFGKQSSKAPKTIFLFLISCSYLHSVRFIRKRPKSIYESRNKNRLAAPWQLDHVNYKRKDLLVKQKYPFSVSSVSWSNVYLKWVLYSPTWEYNNLCCSRRWLVAVYQSYQVPETSLFGSVRVVKNKTTWLSCILFYEDNTKSKYWFSSNEKNLQVLLTLLAK